MSPHRESDEKFEESRGGFGKSTRRTFLSRLGMASLLASAGPIAPALGGDSNLLPFVRRSTQFAGPN